MEFSFANELVYAGTGGGSNRMTPRLYFQATGLIYEFKGQNIPGFVRVLSDSYKKNGKWSYTTWRLRAGAGVKVWRVQGGYLSELSHEGKEVEPFCYIGLNSWDQVPAAMRDVFRVALPKTTARLEENEQPV